MVRINDSTLGDDLLIGTFYRITDAPNQVVNAGTLDVLPSSGAASWAAVTSAVAPAVSRITGALAAPLARASAIAAAQARYSQAQRGHRSRNRRSQQVPARRVSPLPPL